MGADNIIKSMLGPTATSQGWLGIEMRDACVSLSHKQIAYGISIYEVNIRSERLLEMAGGNFDCFNSGKPLDVLVLVRERN